MKTIGIISYNMYGNFTNYGSALQSWALSRAVDKFGYNSVLVDYCPDVHLNKNILDPFDEMWDQSEKLVENCRLSLPAIRANYDKFELFFSNQFRRTASRYTSANFAEVMNDVDCFICGSDTIFSVEESKGFDDGFFANYQCMINNSVAYAASFGDTSIPDYDLLNRRLSNFKAIGLRENRLLSYVKDHFTGPCRCTVDPTLLLDPGEYDEICAERQLKEKYLLLYSRRYNASMLDFADKIAKKNGWKIVDISIMAENVDKGHIMRYDAGIEEFLSLVKNSEFVVTNSFHGLMFSVQFRKQFVIFSRESGNSKIEEALELFGLTDRKLVTGDEKYGIIDYDIVHCKKEYAREQSLAFLQMELGLL